MGYKIKVSPRAEKEVEEVVDWYESKQAKLGQAFLNQFFDTVGFPESNPQIYPVVYRSYRRALMKQFPYGIYYALDESRNTVVILALWHTNKDLRNLKL